VEAQFEAKSVDLPLSDYSLAALFYYSNLAFPQQVIAVVYQSLAIIIAKLRSQSSFQMVSL